MPKEIYPPMHTAEHLLNQTMVRLFNTSRCFSAHIEKKKSKCDYKFDRGLDADELKELEAAVNREIARDLPVKEEMMPLDKAEKQFDLGRLPDKSASELRIVRIGDYDACPCIGPHVGSTGEIGGFRIVSARYEDGVLRVIYKLNSK